MRLSVIRFAALFFLSVIFPLTSFAWNALGHMVVADIAYQNLKPDVRAKVDNLINYLHQEYPNTGSFQESAYWLDQLRSQRIETYTHWHYIDVPLSGDGTQQNKNLIDTDNAVWAMNHIQSVVKNNSANGYERARFLAFLVHIVGDLHQPLHTVTYLSTKHPNGDKGGNGYVVRVNNTNINLHKLWDGGVGSVDEKATQANADAVASKITSLYPKSYFAKQIDDIDPKNWTEEGMNNAKKYVYSTPENEAVSNYYLESGKRVAESQLALAGYRLATILNKLLA